MKYLVIGCGGVGASIASFLLYNGFDVDIIARNKQYNKLKEEGLKVKSDIYGDMVFNNLNVYKQEDYHTIVDVVFVCVKYSGLDGVLKTIEEVSNKDTSIIPILNVYGTGTYIRDRIGKDKDVLDGCIYILSNLEKNGDVVQHNNLFRIVYGNPKQIIKKRYKVIEEELRKCKIEAICSSNIKEDTYKKFSFISPYAAVGLYYNANAKEIREDKDKLEMFINLNKEIVELGKAMNINIKEDVIKDNVDMLMKLDDHITASLQKDIEANKISEINGIINYVIEQAQKYKLVLANYKLVYELAKEKGWR
ncbi:MAG: 2-dehydropantoate 2-reductase [Erysipelotrichaceae bacterium]